MKRVNILILTMVLALIFLTVEIIIVKSVSKYEPEICIVFAIRKITAGETITEDMVEKRKIGISLAHSQSIKDTKEIIERKAKADIEKDEIILSSRITDSRYFEEITVKDKNSRLFAVEFKGDQANGWQLKEVQYVDIIFIPDEKNLASAIENETYEKEGNRIQRIRNIRIAALIDDRGKMVKSPENMTIPKYISFEVVDGLDHFLAYAKGNGRLEISAIPVAD